jgi:DNA-binding MarR family transcriptional regulator
MADINSKTAVNRETPLLGDAGATKAPADRRPAMDTADVETAGGRSMADAAAFNNDPAKLVEFVELLFFAYRDFTGDADDLLQDLGYGRAHHRVIHFVARHPGLRVADLLDILRITKQSLARVLKQLISEGFVTQESGRTDRRERHLYLTQKGQDFAQELSRLQCARIANALRMIGPAGTEHVEAFLIAMISEPDSVAVAELFRKAAADVRESHSA